MIKDGLTRVGAEGVYGCSFSMGDDYWLALYGESAELGEDTRMYTAVGEVAGQGYTAGGKLLSRPKLVHDGRCFVWDFDDLVWPASSIDACCGLIYNKTKNKSLAVMSFPRTMSRNGNFRIVMPPPTASEGVVRFEY
jgi:hypothetical protein